MANIMAQEPKGWRKVTAREIVGFLLGTMLACTFQEIGLLNALKIAVHFLIGV